MPPPVSLPVAKPLNRDCAAAHRTAALDRMAPEAIVARHSSPEMRPRPGESSPHGSIEDGPDGRRDQLQNQGDELEERELRVAALSVIVIVVALHG